MPIESLSDEQMAAEQAAFDWWRERRKAMADFFNAPVEEHVATV